MTLAYVWVDTFAPQLVSDGTLSSIPISFLFGSLAVLTYLIKDRKEPPKFNLLSALMLALMIWLALSMLWARNPNSAYDRLTDVLKVILFSMFVPFSFRTRVHIEAFLLVYLFSIAGHLMPWGIKTFITGGGYGQALGLLRNNASMLSESSTMSGVGVMFVPLVLVMRKQSIILPRGRLRDIGTIVMIIVGMVASVGTFARTALVAMAIMGGSMWLKSKRKVTFTLGAVVTLGILFSVTSDRWTQRIETVTDYQSDDSANGRVMMWRWAWEFAQSNPLGGGLSAYVGAVINLPAENGRPPMVVNARAYHNIFFSALGDIGYPGLALYSGVLFVALHQARTARRLTRNVPEHQWCADLSQAIQVAVWTMLATGCFADISYSPILWYQLCMCACLRNYAVRVTSPAAKFVSGPYMSTGVPGSVIPIGGLSTLNRAGASRVLPSSVPRVTR